MGQRDDLVDKWSEFSHQELRDDLVNDVVETYWSITILLKKAIHVPSEIHMLIKLIPRIY